MQGLHGRQAMGHDLPGFLQEDVLQFFLFIQ